MRLSSRRRRDFVRVGSLTALGLGITDMLGLQRLSASESRSPRATSCILLWLDGGPSHLETFDPKPDAPVEVRGPMGTIATSLPGIRLNEHLERTAGILDKLAILRSITSPLGEHNFGTHYMMTGYKPSPALAYPAFGSTLANSRPKSGVLPPNIAIPNFTPNIVGNGFLPAATAPFSLGGNPERADFRVADLDFYPGLDLKRLAQRRDMVRALDAFHRGADQSLAAAGDSDLERAYDLVSSTKAKGAFELSQESDTVRNRYGRSGGSGIGQSCLLARRLVEGGVPFVTVHSGGWDTHQDLNNLKSRFPGDKSAHLPSLDRALSALISDLDERGMLQETLVIVMGEFGRTPKINSAGGRDHWPNVFSVVMAGGGVRGGQVIGESDSLAEFPKNHPLTPADLAATIYTLLGIDPAKMMHTRDGRPVRAAPDGSQVIQELIG